MIFQIIKSLFSLAQLFYRQCINNCLPTSMAEFSTYACTNSALDFWWKHTFPLNMVGHLGICVCVWKSLSCIRLFAIPMDCSPPGSSVHGILQARTLEWVAISFSRKHSQLRDQTPVSRTAGDSTIWATREAPSRNLLVLSAYFHSHPFHLSLTIEFMLSISESSHLGFLS